MADTENNALIREIDDELKQEQYQKLWKQYGNWVIGSALGLVLVVAGYQGWRHMEMSARLENSQRFVQAQDLAEKGKTDEAIQAFSALAEDGGAGYAMLARFQQASLAADRGDRADAAQGFRAIAADSSLDPSYRGLATVLAVMQDMDRKGADLAALGAELAPLRDESNPWRHTARELSAVIEIARGDHGTARKFLKPLAEDPSTPQGVRARAQQMIDVIGK